MAFFVELHHAVHEAQLPLSAVVLHRLATFSMKLLEAFTACLVVLSAPGGQRCQADEAGSQ